MKLENKKYYIQHSRTLLFGFCCLFIGLFTMWMMVVSIPYFDISYAIIAPVVGGISILSLYFGGKTLLRFNKFVQLELQDDELKYLIVGLGRGASLNFYINPLFKTIKYCNIKSAEISKINLFEKRIQIIQNDNSSIVLQLLNQNEKELENIVMEINKRMIQNSI